MVLEALHELIETLQARTTEHGPALQQSEALTRYALIDPLLRGLGWDTGDPSQVLVEYRSDAGQADYALFGESPKPQVIVEAKKLGTHLDQKVWLQGTGYCQEEGVPFAVITDGRRWEIYDIYQPVAMKDSVVATLDLGDDAAKLCLEALALWRPNVAAGKVKTGSAPLVDTQPSAAEAPAAQNPAAHFSNGGPWHQLSEFTPKSGTKPAEVKFPSGVTATVTSWAEAIAQIAQWLLDSGYLPKTIVPIGRPQTKRLLLAEKPAHLDGAPFKGRRQVGPYCIHTGFNAPDQMKNACFIIKRASQDSADFAVRLQ